jgi:hypothetical protein
VGQNEFAGDVEDDAAAGHPEPDGPANLPLLEEEEGGQRNPAIVAWDPEEEEEEEDKAQANPFAAFVHPPPRGGV